MSRKGPSTGLSWLQLVAGALAAMTSAWVASYLGVAGTIIGAAVGSLVASIASALYVRGLDRGTTFITESGTVVSRAVPAGEVEGADEGEILVTEHESTVAVEESERAFSWKRVLTWTALGLGTALLAIGGYELATGSSFGKADNPTISRPWQDRGTGGGSNDEPAPSESTRPTDDPTADPTTAPTTAPTTPPTTAPAPVPQVPDPTTAPTVEPTQEPSPGAQE